MKARMLIALLVTCVGLAACATGPAYRLAVHPGDYGYRDTQITNDRYRVSFSGDYSMSRETVENFALFRAADVALAHGADHFRITARETLPVTSMDYGPTTTFGYGYGWGSPFWGTGIGYSFRGASETRYETVLEIQLGPDVPAQGPDVYDAHQIKRNLAPQVAIGQKQ